jgi:hypothetical protein
MTRVLRLVAVAVLLTGTAAAIAPAAMAQAPPWWVLHVDNYPGGISNGVRARVVQASQDLTSSGTRLQPRVTAVPLDNVQMNADCDPPLPQNETSVAFNPGDPFNAVAAANDYCGDGFWIGQTTDGGRTWTSTFKDPKTSAGERCFGSDPSVVYSVRNAAFYLSTLCFFSTSPISEVQVWKSVDGGATWTPSTDAAIAITNRAGDGSIDPSVFYDKELLAVDNNPASPHYGRVYVTFIKFHMTPPSGRSDYCPAQVAFTDSIPTADPSRRRPGRPGRLLRQRGLQHRLRPSPVLQALDHRRRQLRPPGADRQAGPVPGQPQPPGPAAGETRPAADLPVAGV